LARSKLVYSTEYKGKIISFWTLLSSSYKLIFPTVYFVCILLSMGWGEYSSLGQQNSMLKFKKRKSSCCKILRFLFFWLFLCFCFVSLQYLEKKKKRGTSGFFFSVCKFINFRGALGLVSSLSRFLFFLSVEARKKSKRIMVTESCFLLWKRNFSRVQQFLD